MRERYSLLRGTFRDDLPSGAGSSVAGAHNQPFKKPGRWVALGALASDPEV